MSESDSANDQASIAGIVITVQLCDVPWEGDATVYVQGNVFTGVFGALTTESGLEITTESGVVLTV